MGKKKRVKPHKSDDPRLQEAWASGCRKSDIERIFDCESTSEKELKIRLIQLGGIREEDLPDDPCSRCGYLFLNTDWVFGLFGGTDPMTPACQLHDELYEIGPTIGMTRREADRLFLDAMKLLTKKQTGAKREFMEYQTKLYYSIVRSTGWLFY